MPRKVIEMVTMQECSGQVVYPEESKNTEISSVAFRKQKEKCVCVCVYFKISIQNTWICVCKYVFYIIYTNLYMCIYVECKCIFTYIFLWREERDFHLKKTSSRKVSAC